MSTTPADVLRTAKTDLRAALRDAFPAEQVSRIAFVPFRDFGQTDDLISVDFVSPPAAASDEPVAASVDVEVLRTNDTGTTIEAVVSVYTEDETILSGDFVTGTPERLVAFVAEKVGK